MTAQARSTLDELAADALKRAQDHLVEQQDPAGWWKGELRTNVTMDAEDLLLRQFLGILEPAHAVQRSSEGRRSGHDRVRKLQAKITGGEVHDGMSYAGWNRLPSLDARSSYTR